MAPLVALSALLLASVAAAKECTTFQIPISIESRQGQFKEIPIENNLDVNAFSLHFTEFGKNYTADLLQGYQTLKGNYEISAQYCKGSAGVIQVLSHGIGFDKTYWDLSYDNCKYSYVDTALAAGYSTLAIDRLGIGNSSHGDPLNEIQAHAEVEALNAVTTRLRKGDITQIGHAYQKVVHVGHSFGSVQSYWLSSKYPNNTDGVVLTGFSGASMFLPYIVAGWDLHSARLNQPLRFGNASSADISPLAKIYGIGNNIVSSLTDILHKVGISSVSSQDAWNIIGSTEINDLINGYNYTVPKYNYPSGYLSHSDLTALQWAFLYPGMYDVGFAVVGEKTKQPVTTGELLTIGSSPPSSSFAGPVLVVTGEHDVPFCGGNCYGKIPGSDAANIPAGVAMVYPNSKAFEAYIQPATGHGLNFHFNATAGYQVIQSFLASHGITA